MTTFDGSHLPPEPEGWDDQEIVREQTPVQIDIYGVKLKVVPIPSDPGDRPASWREVALKINKRLMSIAVGLTEVIDDSLQGARSFFRGMGVLPGSVAAKIASAHAEADEKEDRRQSFNEDKALPSAPAQEALQHLETILVKKRVEGNEAGIIQKGKIVFIFVGRPDLKEALPELIEGTLRSLPQGDDSEE